MAYPGTKRALRPGVFAPLPTFFDEHQELDYDSYKKHLLSESSPLLFWISYNHNVLTIFFIDLATKGMGEFFILAAY
jgi:hypothetical protein